MPLITIASCGRTPNSASACLSATRTPKSPQPGHQSGSALPLKSLIVSGARGWLAPLASISTVDKLMFTPFSFSRFEFRVKQHETEDPKLQRTSRLLKNLDCRLLKKISEARRAKSL